MNAEAIALFEAFALHAKAVAVCAARLLPIVFLAPFLGGQAAPAPVRLATVLSLALGLHFAGAVSPAPEAVAGLWALGAAVIRELCFGLAIGLVASLPFDAARIGGRFIDLFRGTSAEAVLPVSGTREAATGDAFFHLVVALAIASGASSLVLSAAWRTFAVVPAGGAVTSEELVTLLVRFVAGTFAAGFAIGAPIAALSLAVDALLGLFARAAPQLQVAEMGAPIRILGGGAVLWLAVGLFCHRLLTELGHAEALIPRVAEAAR